jgi:hypothetical protein
MYEVETNSDRLFRLADQILSELGSMRADALRRGDVQALANYDVLISQTVAAKDDKEARLRSAIREAASALGIPVIIDF